MDYICVREKYLLDLQRDIGEENTDKSGERRKIIVKSIAKNEKRNLEFKCVTENIGRGRNNSLRRLYVNEEGDYNMKITTNRMQIESRIISHNENHLKKAQITRIYNDKICEKMEKESVRDKILRLNNYLIILGGFKMYS